MVIAALAAMVWAVVVGGQYAGNWSPVVANIARDRDAGMRGCSSRYYETDARQRCEVLFETQYVMEYNTAVFTRLLISLGPLAGVGVWVLVARRRARPKAGPHR